MVLALCVTMLCGRFALSTTVRDASVTQPGQPVRIAGKAAVDWQPAAPPRGQSNRAKAGSGAETGAAQPAAVGAAMRIAQAAEDPLQVASDVTAPADSGGLGDSTLTRWSCDQELRDFQGDQLMVREMIDSQLETASEIFSDSSGGTDDANGDKRRALGIAMTDAIWASFELEDDQLATTICWDYLLPNISYGSSDRVDYLSREEVASTIVSALQEVGEIDKAIDVYTFWIPQDTCANDADANRIRVASLLAGEQRYAEAIGFLSEVDQNGDCAAGRLLIPGLQKELNQQRAQNSPVAKAPTVSGSATGGRG